MRGADQADRDGIDDRSVAGGDQLIEAVATPGRARDVDEGAALRRGLEVALARLTFHVVGSADGQLLGNCSFLMSAGDSSICVSCASDFSR